MSDRAYLAIDLKSFYASVECIERGMDPLDTHLVVADESRTDKTICLAVTPSLKALGVPGRARLFQAKARINEANLLRREHAPGRVFTGSSTSASVLRNSPASAIDFIIAPPRMAHYIRYSTRIYQVYLKYVAPEDIVVYSIDEVFLDVTNYLTAYGLSPRQLAERIVEDVVAETGITATVGVGTNLFLAKVAMDIVAKQVPGRGVRARVAELDEARFRRELWDHRPLTDFWRVGPGYARKLQYYGLHTMGDIARCSVRNEALLYRLFGKNAELLIDHAWGWEPCTIADIKAYRPGSSSLGSGQVLHAPYEADKARLVLQEMADRLVLDLVDKGLVTRQITVTVGYDIENLADPARRQRYRGPVVRDPYGREIPRHAHGTTTLDGYTSSTRLLVQAAVDLYDRITDGTLLVRRLNITAGHVLREELAPPCEAVPAQLDLFTDYDALRRRQEQEAAALQREKRMQRALLTIQKKFGKNAILKGMNLQEGATARDRNQQIGGHKA